MPEETPNICTITKTYNVREDQSVTVPRAIQDVLGWQPGTELVYEVDVTNRKLIISRKQD